MKMTLKGKRKSKVTKVLRLKISDKSKKTTYELKIQVFTNLQKRKTEWQLRSIFDFSSTKRAKNNYSIIFDHQMSSVPQEVQLNYYAVSNQILCKCIWKFKRFEMA